MPHLTRERIMVQFCDIKRMSNVTVRGRSATAAKTRCSRALDMRRTRRKDMKFILIV